MKKKLLLSSVMIAAALLIPVTTTTTAYAQQTQGKACPTGFTLTKGKCVSEPNKVCENGYEESPLGNCIVGVGSPSATPSQRCL
jgi:hypothetical protein